MIWCWLAALLSGALLTLSLPPWDQGWLCWVGLTPLISAIWLGRPWTPPQGEGQGRSHRFSRNLLKIRRWLCRPWARGAVLGYAAGLVFFWAAFYWLTTVTGIGWFILAFYMALYPAAWGAVVTMIGEEAGDFTRSFRNLRLAAIGAAAWTALEWVRGWMFTGFGWNNVGTALHADLPFIQIVEYTGVGGLSFLCVLTNLIIVITVKRFIEEIRKVRIRPHWDFSLTMVVIVLVFLFGVRRIYKPVVQETFPLRVAAIQPNIPLSQKYSAAAEQVVFDQLTFLTESALAWGPQLLVWPEAATVRGLFEDATNLEFVRNFGQRDDYNFLFGSIDFDPAGHYYNIAVLMTKRAEAMQFYRKMHLVPFGEYIPFRHSFPFFAWLVGDLVPADYSAGKEPLLFRLHNPELAAAPLICFEDTLGELTRKFILNGGQLLVNVTNDGWFLESAGSRQHLANAIFRAVENRRPLVRSANTGVTAFVDSTGRVTSALDRFQPGILTETVPIPASPAPLTFYTRHGEVFSQGCTLIAIAGVGIVIVRRRRKRHSDLSN